MVESTSENKAIRAWVFSAWLSEKARSLPSADQSKDRPLSIKQLVTSNVPFGKCALGCAWINMAFRVTQQHKQSTTAILRMKTTLSNAQREHLVTLLLLTGKDAEITVSPKGYRYQNRT
jgi:hypothetical protein